MALVLVEIIGSSPEDCTAIEAGGGDRIELCSSLVLGGLTPSVGTLAEAKARCSLPIMAMVRPRAAGMHYSETEFACMERDAAALLDAGADGIVFGVLNEDGSLDLKRMAALERRAEGKQTVCHRAFDVTPDPFIALEQLVDLGMTRVLTSGQQPTAIEGADLIKSLIERSDGRIEILPGAGITAENAAEFVRATGCNQIHLAAFTQATDPSGQGNPMIRFAGSEPPLEGQFDLVSQPNVDAVIRAVSSESP